MLVALEPQCVEISDCVFEGRDQEDIGAGDQVQYLIKICLYVGRIRQIHRYILYKKNLLYALSEEKGHITILLSG